MLRVEDKENVQRAGELGVRLVVALNVETVEHGEEAARVGVRPPRVGPAPRVGRVIRAPDPVPIRAGRDGRGLAQNAEHLLVPQRLVVYEHLSALQSRIRVRVKCPEGSHGRHKHSHGVRVVSEVTDEIGQVLMNVCVRHDLVLEVDKLIAVRQLSVKEKERHLQKSTLLCQNLNRVAPIGEPPGFPVDEANTRLSNRRVRQTRI
mmetsp:Transcript_835/g.2154  ORF Transcript_835/g.2154 Transcript_835/m.2154 type:complete len:205 (-) Transcript_835:291-905(-)